MTERGLATEGARWEGVLNSRSALRCCRLVGLVALLVVAAVAQGAPTVAKGTPVVAQRTPAVAQGTLPHLEKQGTAIRLIVKGRPMLVLGGELGNSSASSATYMAPHWPRLKQFHLNAVLTPVTWELIEPVEGRFDWSSVDALLKAARANDLKLFHCCPPAGDSVSNNETTREECGIDSGAKFFRRRVGRFRHVRDACPDRTDS